MLRFKCDRCNTPHNSDRAGDRCSIVLPDDSICTGVVRITSTKAEILAWASRDRGLWLERLLERETSIIINETMR
jgi:hypothetical protein